MAFTQSQINNITSTLQNLQTSIAEFCNIEFEEQLSEDISPQIGSFEDLKQNFDVLKSLQDTLIFSFDDPSAIQTVIPINKSHMPSVSPPGQPLNSALEHYWRQNAVTIIDEIYQQASSLSVNALEQFSTTKGPFSYGTHPVDVAMQISNYSLQFLNQFDVTIFGRKKIRPPSFPTSEAEIIMIDDELESFLNIPATANHYIGSLESASTSDGARQSPYLPIRYAPHHHEPPLANGWDDHAFRIINQNNQMIDPKGNFESDGIELPLGYGILVTEFVLSNTGIWVGFVPLNPADLTTFTLNRTRVLYTRPRYLRRVANPTVNSTPVTDLDPRINHTFISVNTPDPRPSIPDGAAIIAPNANLNWRGLKYGEVRLVYYNFNQHNESIISELGLDADSINAEPTLRYSEGYFYFVTIEGARKNVAALLEEVSIPPASDPNTSPAITLAKQQEAQSSELTMREAAMNMILEYNAKAIPEDENVKLALRDAWTIPVAKHLSTSAPSTNNTKMLFAMPASVVEGLPNTERFYYEQYEKDVSDFFPEFGQGGKNFVFTMRMDEVRKTANNLVKVFTKIKGRLEEFKSSGGIITNANNINYNIDSQIARIESFPDVLEEFLVMQAAPKSVDRDYITDHLRRGLQQDGNAVVQIGLRDNKKLGTNVRQTISFVLFSPDPEMMRTASTTSKTELMFLDPNITEDELSGKRDISRSAIACRRALPWLRSKFLDVEGCRTLHYFFAHRNLISYEQTINEEFTSNNWVKFLQAYTVPPLLVSLSKDRAQDEEEIDCKKLIEQLRNSHSTIRESDKALHELVKSKCAKAYMEEYLKDTSATDPESSPKGLHSKQLIAKQGEALWDAAASWDTLSTLYDAFLHKLDPQGLIMLLMACLQKKLGIPMTAQALCEVAIEELIKISGVEEFKKLLFSVMPELAIFFGDADDYIEAKLGEDVMAKLDELNGEPYTTQKTKEYNFGDTINNGTGEPLSIQIWVNGSGWKQITIPVGGSYTLKAHEFYTASLTNTVSDGFAKKFTQELVQNNARLENAPIAIALTSRLLEGNLFAVGLPYPDGTSLGGDIVKMVADMERRNQPVPLEPFWVNPQAAYENQPSAKRYTVEQCASHQKSYMESGFSFQEARASLVKDGILEVSPSFIKAALEQSPDLLGAVDKFADPIYDLGKTLMASPSSPQENSMNNIQQPIGQGVADAAAGAKQMVAFLKQIIDLQQICEMIVGPMLQMPGNLFARPGDFVQTWQNWWDNLTARLKRTFRNPFDSIPQQNMPSKLPTDDLIKDYADKLVAAFATMIGMILGEILHLILKDLLEKCLEEADIETPPLRPPGPGPRTIPLPILGEIAKTLPPGDTQPDYLAWLRDIIDYLNPLQLCAMLQGDATDLTVEHVLARTKDKWPDVWAAGIDNGPDVRQIFIELGQKEPLDLQICDAIQATTPILVDACESQYDYDARCAALQMEGLTKEECDIQIQKELDDLRNKLRSLAGFVFPDSDPFDGLLPHPCGPRGYFQLPPAMEDTMSKVAENFLDGVKASMIRDLQGIQFFALPPRAVSLMTDPEELIATHRDFHEALEDKIEALTMMPVEQVLGTSDKFNADNAVLNILTYTTTTKLSYGNNKIFYGYSRAGIEAQDIKEAYKAIPNGADLDLGGSVLSPGRTSGLKDTKPRSLLNIGHFSQDIYGTGIKPVGGTGANKKTANTKLPAAFINEAGTGLGKKYPLKSALKIIKPWFTNYAEEVYKKMYDGDASLAGAGTTTDPLLGTAVTNLPELPFPDLGQEIDALIRGDKKSPDGMPEPPPKNLHLKVLDFHVYKIIYLAERSRFYRDTWSFDFVQRKLHADLKYKKIYKLTDKVSDLIPPGQFWIPNEYQHTPEAFSGVPSARPAFLQMFANFVGMPIEDLDPTFISMTSINKVPTTDEGNEFLDNFSEPQRAALDVIASYARNDNNDYLSAFIRMPIGVAVGLEKDILRHLYPRWWGLYESIEEDGGVVFDFDLYTYGGSKQIVPQFVVRKDFFRDPESRLENMDQDSLLYPFKNKTSAPVNKKFINAFDDTEKVGMKETFPVALYKNTATKQFAQTIHKLRSPIQDVKAKTAYEWDPQYFDGVYVGGKMVAKWKEKPVLFYVMGKTEMDNWIASQTPPGVLNPDKYETIQELKKTFPKLKFASDYYEQYPVLEYEFPGIYDRIVFAISPLEYEDGEVTTLPFGIKQSGIGPYYTETNEDEDFPLNSWGSWHLNKKYEVVLVKEGIEADPEELSELEKEKEMINFDYYPFSNFNTNVQYWPMPFVNPLSVGNNAKRAEEMMDKMKSIFYENVSEGSALINQHLNTGGWSGMNNTLVYQQFPVTKSSKNICSSEMKDCYKISKGLMLGKINALSPAKSYAKHDPSRPLDLDAQIAKAEYDFEIEENYDTDVLRFMEDKLGIKNADDCENIIHKMNQIEVFGVQPYSNIGNVNDAYVWYNKVDQLTHADARNYNQAIFAKLMAYKTRELLKTWAPSTEHLFTDYAEKQLMHFVGTYDYAACKLAYSSKIFGKLRLSRLNQRKFMDKLWKKILRTPLTDDPTDPRCLAKLQELAAGTTTNFPDGVETDFFDIESVKPEIMEFYKKSVCADIYESQGDYEYTASQRALIEGAIILLIRVYTLEICLAGIVAWDAYDLEDVFSQPIMTKILVKNINKDIDNFTLFNYFVNDIVKKKELIKNASGYVITENQSGVEYIMRQEAAKINSIISSMFKNPRHHNPINTKLTLSKTSATDPSVATELNLFLDLPQTNFISYPPDTIIPVLGTAEQDITIEETQKHAYIIGTLAEYHGTDYPTLPYMVSNPYTHNYGLGRLENSAYFNGTFLANWYIQSVKSPFKHGPEDFKGVDNPDKQQNWAYFGGFNVGDLATAFPTQDFSGNEQKLSQNNFFHSVPIGYFRPTTGSGAPDDGGYVTNPLLLAYPEYIDQAKLAYKPHEYYHYKNHIDLPRKNWSHNIAQRNTQDRLLANVGQFENKHEHLAGSELNSKMGNFIIQTYVKIEDQDLEGRKALKARHLLFNVTEPCDLSDTNQGAIVEADTELGADAILSEWRDATRESSYTTWPHEDAPNPVDNQYRANPFGACIYGVVPLEVFSWFLNCKFFPWINDPENEKIKLLYNAHGFKPFFKSIKMGMRLTYVSSYGSAVQSKMFATYDKTIQGYSAGYMSANKDDLTQFLHTALSGEYPIEKPHGDSITGLDVAKSGLCQRTYMLADYQYSALEEPNFSASDATEDTSYLGNAILNNVGSEEIEEAFNLGLDGQDELVVDVDQVKGLKGDWWPQLFDEIHIPVSEVEKDIVMEKGRIKVGDTYYDFNEFSYSEPIPNAPSANIHEDGFPNGKQEDYNLLNFLKDPDNIFNYEAMYRMSVQTPGNFYYKHLSSDLLNELQSTPEFKLVFNHLIPIKRYMALGFLYSSDNLLTILGDPNKLLEESKRTILSLIEGILAGADDYTFIPEAVREQLKHDLLANLLNTSPRPPDESLTKLILEIIWKTMLLILKGFVELTDPAISIAQKIIDVSKAVYNAVIMTIEATYNALSAGLQMTIDTARSSLTQAEMNVAMAQPALEQLISKINSYPTTVPDEEIPDGWEAPPERKLENGGAKTDGFDGSDLKNSSIAWDKEFVPAPDHENAGPAGGEWTTLWESFVEAAENYNDLAKTIKDLDAEIKKLEAEKKELDDTFTEPCTKVGGKYKGGDYQCAKKRIDDIFGSKFMLPGMWAAMLPSMTPYMGGVIPPPFFVGPPSTIPGMIYLILLMSDAYDALEEQKEDTSEGKSWEEKCAEEL